MRTDVDCGRDFAVTLDEERPIERRAVMALAERIANRLEELEHFAARIARLNIAGELCGTAHSRRAHPYNPTDRDEAQALYRLIHIARGLTGLKPSNLAEEER